MKLKDLMKMSARFDPDDTVLIDARSQCLLLLDHRPGMSEPLYEDDEGLQLTEVDRDFLQKMRVRF